MPQDFGLDGPAGGKAPGAAEPVHSVLKLGWEPLCLVVCNGLYGEFLGGHDKDLYIRCTSSGYKNLPDIDSTAGGRIMTCSQFERAAGRELSKKWKESIHVIGCGEGSRATLLSWLKRATEAQFGAAAVGQEVWVCWTSDGDMHRGLVTGYSRDTGKHTVAYTSKCVEELHLPVELLSFGSKRPRPSTQPSPGSSRGASPSSGEDGSLRNQSSGLSVPVDHAADDHARAAKRARTPLPKVLHRWAEVAGGYASAMAPAPPPAPPPPQGQQGLAAATALPSPPPLGPGTGGPDDVGSMAAWMHCLAVVLDRAPQPRRAALSVPAAFQALLALSRRHDATIQGLYEALHARLKGCADQSVEATAAQLLEIMDAAVQLGMAGARSLE